MRLRGPSNGFSLTRKGLAVHGWDVEVPPRAGPLSRAEVSAVLHAGKMVVLSSTDACGTWTHLEVSMTKWRKIDPLADIPGPSSTCDSAPTYFLNQPAIG
jgi:hypothetical protein